MPLMERSSPHADAIDKDSPVPIYYQLKRLLEERIRRGELKAGDRVPTEQELCERYDISRTPVRQALTELAREGRIKRYTRRGTFVSDGQRSERRVMPLRAVIVDGRWEYPLRTAASQLNSLPDGPRIELAIQEVPLIELRRHLISAVARGEAPDLALVDSVWVAEFVRGDFLFPLNDLDAEWVEGEYQASFYPAFVEAGFYDGAFYAIPSEVDLALLWYRRDLLAAEELGQPRTWGELVAVARHFRRREVRERHGLSEHSLVFPGGQAAGEATTYHLLPFLWSGGADLMADGLVVLDSPRTVSALRFLHDLIHVEGVTPAEVVGYGWETALTRFARGEVALAVGGSYAGALMREEAHWGPETFRQRAGFCLIPAGPGGQRSTIAGGMAYAIPRQSRAPAEAMELLKRAVAPEVMTAFCRATGHNPPRADVAKRLTMTDDWFLAETAALLPGARVRPRMPDYARVSELFREMVASVLSGDQEVEAAVAQAAERISLVASIPKARY